jgi:hypothetical protein
MAPVVLSIDAPDQYYDYRLREIVTRNLEAYGANLSGLRIKIKITDHDQSSVFSEKEVIKSNKRIVANIEIYDQHNEIIATKNVDTFGTYEASDEFPYAENASKTATLNAMQNDLGQSISLLFIEANKVVVDNSQVKR